MTNDETAVALARLEKLIQRTETHLYNRMDSLEELFNENPDRVNEAFDEVEVQRKYLLDRVNTTDRHLMELKEKARLTNEQVFQKLEGLEEQVFALGKLAENLEERMRRMEQNWTLVKKQMAMIQNLVNGIAPDDKKLPVDWLDQLEVIRDIVNPQTNTEQKQ